MKFKTNLKFSNNLIDLTPLVDVIFLMLIFFVVSSEVLPLKSLDIENPTLTHDTQPLTTQLLVVVDAQNVIYVGSKKAITELAAVGKQLDEEIALLQEQHAGLTPSVVLSVDKTVEYDFFLKIFSLIQEKSPHIRLVYKSANG